MSTANSEIVFPDAGFRTGVDIIDDVRAFISSARSRKVVTSRANAIGSHPAIGPDAFFLLRNLLRSPPELGASGSLREEASCGMVCVCTWSAPASVRRCAIISSPSRGESRAVIRITSGMRADSAAIAASRESTTTSSACTLSWMTRLRMAACRLSGSIASTSATLCASLK
jgi:hypothetical protein